MSVQFSGWEVIDDGASFPGVELQPSQKPQRKGVYTMYHGTSIASAQAIIASGFKPSAGGRLGKGVYVSRDKNKAANYPLFSMPGNRVTLQVRVRVGRVKRIDSGSSPMAATWHTNGYDTAWMPPYGGGLEEDCVYDPKRVQVIGIAVAPDDNTKKDLEQLLSKTLKKHPRSGARHAKVCSLCKRKTQQGATHVKQQCWKCGDNICILMSKHFCPTRA